MGASNGYDWLGDAASEAMMAISGCTICYNPEGAPNVSGSALSIVLSPSEADLQILIAAD